MPGHGHTVRSARQVGREFRALGWLIRHPGFALVPAVVVAALVHLGPAATAAVVVAVVLLVLVWWRGHPASFDRYAAPRLRTLARRWGPYRGGRWRGVVADCDLVREDRRVGAVLYPAVSRVRSITPTLDTLRVRMVRGHDVAVWTERLPALADALGVHRVSVTRARPGVLSLVVEREMPFRWPIDPTPIPDSASAIDIAMVVIGENEYGQAFTMNGRQHTLVVGGTGAGKSGALWNPLRALAPAIRCGLVRVWCIDLKGGTETDRGAALFHRWAITGEAARDLLTDFRDSMLTRQQQMRAKGVRQNVISRATPLDILVIDELAMLTAYGDRWIVRDCVVLLAAVLTQARAADHVVWGYVQEPTKDVVDVRDLFPVRLCLGVNAASHVDMALGEGARERGALADEIPNDPDHAGIGFAILPGSRLPVRFRLGWVQDGDIDELARRAAPLPLVAGTAAARATSPADLAGPAVPVIPVKASRPPRTRLSYTADDGDTDGTDGTDEVDRPDTGYADDDHT